MKILIADKFEASGVEQLKGIADELFNEPGLKADALAARLKETGAELLIVRSTKVPAAVIGAAPHLAVIIRAGSGVDNIDMKAASAHGIQVSNCPGQNSAAVAELTLGLMIALDRRIPDNVIDLRNHKWNKSLYSKARGLKGRTLGIIGAGNIGTLVARTALALEMNVLYYHLGRQRRLVDHPNCVRADLDDLLRRSDVVSVHVPGGSATRRLIDERRLALMPPHALLINTSRADVVDQQALLNALRDNKLRGAALDVYEDEPAADAREIQSPVCDLPNLYGTHHIGASTEQAQNAIADETVRIVRTYKTTGKLLNCVNMQEKPAAHHMLVVRLHNKPGGLAHVFHEIAEAGINAEEMDHVVYDGGEAACAHIRINQRPAESVVNRIRTGHPNVVDVQLMQVD